MKNEEISAEFAAFVNELSFQVERIARAAKNMLDMAEAGKKGIADNAKTGDKNYVMSAISRIETKQIKEENILCSAVSEVAAINPKACREPFYESFLAVRQTKDFIVIRSPILHRRAHTYRKAIPGEELVNLALGSKTQSFYPGEEMDLYSLSVYPEETDPRFVLDSDNLDTKTIGDALCAYLGIDDSCVNVRLIIFGILSNELEEGTYTVAVRRQEVPMGETELCSLIDLAFEVQNDGANNVHTENTGNAPTKQCASTHK